jgi:hypothetical protein
VTLLNVADSASIAETPANANGTDRNIADNTTNSTPLVIGIFTGGGATGDLSLTGNWSNATVPDFTVVPQNLSFPTTGVTNAPVLSSAVATANNVFFSGSSPTKDLTINSGAEFIIAANKAISLQASKVKGAGTLHLSTGATITRTTGQVDCALRKDFSAGQPVADSPDSQDSPDSPGTPFIYPVGTAAGFFPVTATIDTGSTGGLTVQSFDGPATGAPANSLQRYWHLSVASGSILANTLVFDYNSTTAAGPNGDTNYHVIRATAGTALGFPQQCPTTACVDAANNKFTISNVSTFGNDWTAGELSPTAAMVSVSGRVFDANGAALRNARVTLDDGTGHSLTAITNAFGYYHFDTVQAGRAYIVGASARGYTFTPRVVMVNDQLTDLDMAALP